MKQKYGLEWPDHIEDWQIELKLYQFPHWAKEKGLAPWKHFVNAAQILWGPKNPKAQFVWHPWAVDMTMAACSTNELGLCGPSSCGKSEWSAIWVILNYLVDPAHTLYYVTSTTIPRAKDKIWGTIEKYWSALPDHVASVGKLVGNPTPSIWTEINGKRIAQAGIHLVAVSPSQGREAINKLQGAKARAAVNANDILTPGHSRCGLMADELSDLAHGILSAISNLKSNMWWHAVGAANPRHKLDPFSIFVEPEDGYESITVDSSRWKTRRGGICLHFDDMKNPNYLQYMEYVRDSEFGKNVREDGSHKPYTRKWPIKGGDKIAEEVRNGDMTSPEFWRNFRGFWSPVGSEATIYTDEDIKASGGDRRFTNWLLTRPKIRACGVDSAFSSGGDSTIAVVGDLGYCAERRTMVVDIIAVEELTINAADKTKTPTRQVGEKIRDIISKYQVPIPDLGFDSTNIPAADSLAEVLGSNDFFRINFSGAATSTPVSELDPTPASDKYGSRVTELWFFGKELLRHRQLYGITDELALELIVRKYDTGRAGTVSRLTAESKKEMKKRTGGRSPDKADAMCILLDVFRQRHGLRTSATKLNKTATGGSSAWLEFCKKTSSPRSGNRLAGDA